MQLPQQRAGKFQICYVDSDGVLADFDGGLAEAAGQRERFDKERGRFWLARQLRLLGQSTGIGATHRENDHFFCQPMSKTPDEMTPRRRLQVEPKSRRSQDCSLIVRVRENYGICRVIVCSYAREKAGYASPDSVLID